MTERLVDVLDSSGSVIHTYPITLGELGDAADDSAYEAKALEAAAQGQLVPEALSSCGIGRVRWHDDEIEIALSRSPLPSSGH
jgi:hypothetical protein